MGVELLDCKLFGSTIYDKFGKPYIKADFRSGAYTPLNGGMPDDLVAVMQLANIKKLDKLQL